MTRRFFVSDVCIFLLVLTTLTGRTDVYLLFVIQNRHEHTYVSTNESLVFISTSQSRTRKPIFRISLTQNVVGARE